uniref:Small nuclear ribonucleoprotein n=1 Tax=Rhizophora mucronata TaxID=61149 RepID=A0A2P2KIV1_RHIMU
MSIHTYIHTCNGAVNNSSVLEFNRDGLVVQLHQKPDELHRCD